MRNTISWLTACYLLLYFSAVVFASQPTTHKVKSRTTNKGIAGAELSFFEGTKRTRVTTDENGYAKRFSLPFSHGRTVRVRIEAEGYFPSESTCVMPECMDQITHYLTEKPKHARLQDNIVGTWGSRSFAVYKNGKAYIACGNLKVKRKNNSLSGVWRQEYFSPHAKNDHQIVDQDCTIRTYDSHADILGSNPKKVKGSGGYNPDMVSGAYHAPSQTIVGPSKDSAGVKGIREFDKKRRFKLEIAKGSLSSRVIGKWCVGIYYQGTFYLGELMVEPGHEGTLLLRYTKNGKRHFLDQEARVRFSGSKLTIKGIKAMLYEEKGEVFSGKTGRMFSFHGTMKSNGVISGQLEGTSGKDGIVRLLKLAD